MVNVGATLTQFFTLLRFEVQSMKASKDVFDAKRGTLIIKHYSKHLIKSKSLSFMYCFAISGHLREESEKAINANVRNYLVGQQK